MLATIKQEVNQIGCKFQELAKDYYCEKGITAVATALAILNTQIFCAQKNRKVLIRHENGTLKFYPENIPKLFTEPLSVVVPIDFMAKHLKKYWRGFTYVSRTKIREIRTDLSERFKLFTLEERDWSDPSNRHRAPNPCGSFNLVAALISARALEDILLTYRKLEAKQLDWTQPIGNGNYPEIRDEDNCALPAHKAYSTFALYNRIFNNVDVSGREQADSIGCELLPEVAQAIRVEAQTLQAEEAFEAVLDADPNCDPELALITQTFDYIETVETPLSNGSHVAEDRIISRHLLCEFVRLTMKIPPKICSLCRKEDAGVNVPAWVFDRGSKALTWWQKRLTDSGLWFTEMAPDWVLDEVLPF